MKVKATLSIIILSLCLISTYWGYQYNNVTKQLKVSQADLAAKSERIDVLKTELDKSNLIIGDLTSEEHEFYYIGKFYITNYCACEKCCGYWATIRPKDENGNSIVYTASGTIAEAGRTIAVDTSVIPYGTEVYIAGSGMFVAEDCGGGIKDKHIDIYYDDHEQAKAGYVGYKDVWVLISEEENNESKN